MIPNPHWIYNAILHTEGRRNSRLDVPASLGDGNSILFRSKLGFLFQRYPSSLVAFLCDRVIKSKLDDSFDPKTYWVGLWDPKFSFLSSTFRILALQIPISTIPLSVRPINVDYRGSGGGGGGAALN